MKSCSALYAAALSPAEIEASAAWRARRRRVSGCDDSCHCIL